MVDSVLSERNVAGRMYIRTREKQQASHFCASSCPGVVILQCHYQVYRKNCGLVMKLVFRLMTVCAVAALSTAQLNYNNPVFVPEYIQTQSSVVEAIQQPPLDQQQETANINFQQLPKPDAPKPFYTIEPQPSSVLRAPSQDAVVTNFNLQNLPQIPSQDLQLPSITKWNPNDDPNLYYPVVVDKIVPLQVPTGVYPKKYNKHNEKEKSPVRKLKALVDVAAKQDPLKTLYNIAKQDNKNLLKLEKLESLDGVPSRGFEGIKVTDAVPAASIFDGFSHGAESAALGGLSHGSAQANSFGGLSHAPITASVGHHAPGPGGDRVEFHVQGHDGPKSYKYGYDTGKGHNRHFRFEEKDKHGYVKGHYGYYDKHGKLRMIHYDSAPHEGFHASEAGVGPN